MDITRHTLIGTAGASGVTVAVASSIFLKHFADGSVSLPNEEPLDDVWEHYTDGSRRCRLCNTLFPPRSKEDSTGLFIGILDSCDFHVLFLSLPQQSNEPQVRIATCYNAIAKALLEGGVAKRMKT